MSDPITCDFCGKDRSQVNRMWSNDPTKPVIFICDLCVTSAYRAQTESRASSSDVQT